MVTRQMGFMVVQMNAPCDACRGQGQRTTKDCIPCGNRRFVERERSLEAKILPGMCDNDRIVFEGECSDSNEFSTPGDIVVVLHVVPGPYTWKDANGSTLIFFEAGMPKKGGGFGDLKVEIDVTPPVVTRWSDSDREKLEAVLGKVTLTKTDAQDLLHYSE